jgi:hypothetical protein
MSEEVKEEDEVEEVSNVIPFPREHIRPHLLSELIDINETRKDLFKENADTITQITVDFILNNMGSVGIIFDFNEDPRCMKEFALVIESLKSLLYKYYELEHPMQLVAENAFTLDGNIIKYKNTETAVGEVTQTEEYLGH